jgi:hypothetical protein
VQVHSSPLTIIKENKIVKQFLFSNINKTWATLMLKVFLAFYRLASCVYFSKHRAAFQPTTSVKEVYDNIACDDNELGYLTLIQHIREKRWERVVRRSDDPQC